MESTLAFLAFVAIIPATWLLLRWGKVYWDKRLREWAAGEGLTLVSYKGNAFFEGPGRFTRTENQTSFRVKVRGADGRYRTGHVAFGKNFNPFSRPDELVSVQWD